METLKKRFPKRLKEIRLSMRLNQAEFAEKIGVSRAAYSMYETGKNLPGIEVLDALFQQTGYPYEYIMGETDNSTPETVGLDKGVGLSTQGLDLLKNDNSAGRIINRILCTPGGLECFRLMERYNLTRFLFLKEEQDFQNAPSEEAREEHRCMAEQHDALSYGQIEKCKALLSDILAPKEGEDPIIFEGFKQGIRESALVGGDVTHPFDTRLIEEAIGKALRRDSHE